MNAEAPRSAGRLIGAALVLYRRYPLLFLTLAAAVIVPYELAVLVATGAGPFEVEELSGGTSLALSLADVVLVTPLVSALHVHAVAAVREDARPQIDVVARQGLAALPVVAAASVMSGLGIFLGLLALIVPGIYLFLRWFVVAQAAAIEREGWTAALRRSHELVKGNYWHVVGFGLLVFLVVMVPVAVGMVVEGLEPPRGVGIVTGIALDVVAWSFGALGTALLYFDLRARLRVELAGAPPQPLPAPAARAEEATQHDLDPRRYSDDERPSGWYIDPGSPYRMRYWTGGDQPEWAERTKRTPGKARRSWDRRRLAIEPTDIPPPG